MKDIVKSIDDYLNKEITVRNATTEDYSPVDNALELYYKKFPTHNWPSYKCPSCGNMMYRKRDNVDKHPIIVGGHLKNSLNNIFILPICEECNDKKENLEPFKVRRRDLLVLE